jgi:hypothetical protein
MNDDMDDLDRAIFALPLETPPRGLREAILRATVYAEAIAPTAFGRWEIAGIGGALALALWFVILTVADRSLAATFSAGVYDIARAFTDPTTLAWLATGGSIAVVASFVGGGMLRLPVRIKRS